MKKFFIISLLLFIVSVCCKKENVGGGGLCACSPVRVPELNLVIKNTTGDDLLNDKTAGAYAKDKITVYRKDEKSNVIPIDFAIRPGFSYGNEKFNFNFLNLGNLGFLQKTPADIIYLKLGDKEAQELHLQLNQGKYAVDKLIIGNEEAVKDSGTVAKYADIFYLIQ
ncbi:hypothetical protein MTO98_07060 [Mucilaginibacter sp. SMC90]|uniref:hypothetical protein n=1 Tax=Mucilaginibacter sp. SMC90 TaxID=2929803 RepID=UPI001FB1E7F5|nr:hypothetical protein [Mucilaginibacter sp. SMC90]UOE50834.1 hypothetical protein MTO98_07060 [Mucilaginibacter sp. SMC90]